MEFACLGEAAAQDAFRPEPCAHVRGDCAAVVASHLERHALEVEATESVREDGADGIAAEPAARDAKQPQGWPDHGGCDHAMPIAPRRATAGAAHVAIKSWRVVPATQRFEIGQVEDSKGNRLANVNGEDHVSVPL